MAAEPRAACLLFVDPELKYSAHLTFFYRSCLVKISVTRLPKFCFQIKFELTFLETSRQDIFSGVLLMLLTGLFPRKASLGEKVCQISCIVDILAFVVVVALAFLPGSTLQLGCILLLLQDSSDRGSSNAAV